MILVALIWIPSFAFSLDLPKPSAGYSWTECPEIKGALLVPDGWSFRRVASEDKLAYFVTEEAFQPPQTFDVGVTVNVIRDVPAKMSKQPSIFAKEYVELAAKSNSEAKTWTTTSGTFVSHGVLYVGVGNKLGFKFYNLIIANDRTGTAYSVTFEAPTVDWDRKWQVVEQVLKQLALDDEV